MRFYDQYAMQLFARRAAWLLIVSALLALVATGQARGQSQADYDRLAAIYERSQDHRWPNHRYLDSNRVYVLTFIRDALSTGALTDAILAEPHYESPSTGARRTSLGEAVGELMALEDAVAIGALARTSGIKRRIQRAMTTWHVEMMGYYGAILQGRVPRGLSAAIRLELRRY